MNQVTDFETKLKSIDSEFELIKKKQGLFSRIERLKKEVDKKKKTYEKEREKLEILINEFSDETPIKNAKSTKDND